MQAKIPPHFVFLTGFYSLVFYGGCRWRTVIALTMGSSELANLRKVRATS